MIKRVVKMEFEEKFIEKFLQLFDKHKLKIRNYKGCEYLELWQDTNKPTVFMTYSYWHSEENLNQYRQSELFKSVWSKTKIMFAAQPQAWSLNTIHQLK
ncbi:putative quinol monooxygenase [Mesohalobacter halotolerans]|jgi:quinol monooxygenase YgiN|uniref:Antibiotic biosynthesis monooxygenase n=1 Tax=Mesohalobacter halotolerans TaxID=1883405 RepID=A0A4U5TP76_9FLAO|nr:antibiotic biosynthesis monooxygenase family protein [Mesohalobacter halotolerans]MBS3739211.1 antibiotic biosynthesis monooxygenase [Psychroflexus sp.]NBC58895.1 antibiotic biosynthesis monooxygenase [Bacteroidota bacterium]TKS55880.1 antibiotic biosynthesis monooxygenase [Mesohalobacter halotolerans]